jgi:hypothetical protein
MIIELVIVMLSVMMVIQIVMVSILMSEVKRIQQKDWWMEKAQEQFRAATEKKRDDQFKESIKP